MIFDFTKYHGIGNDFIIMNGIGRELSIDSESIAFMCDRHFGIGADGLIIVRPSTSADVFMDYYNSDGSIAEMCGNGIRCLAGYVWDEGISESATLAVETRAGIKVVSRASLNGAGVAVSVDMGEPILDTPQIPVNFDTPRVVNETFSVNGNDFRATCISMGNPHCVLFVDDSDAAPVETLGPQIETSAYFPNKTNVEFAQIIDAATIKLRVWERGCGETLACGTGACATLVAANLNGKTGRAATIHLLGGILHIEWRQDNRVIMTGPAQKVFSGSLELFIK